MGYQPNPIFSIALSTIVEDGGHVPLIDVVILRVYDVMFVEKIDDKTIVRSTKEDEAEYRKWELKYEKIFQGAVIEYERDPDYFEQFDIVSGEARDKCIEFTNVFEHLFRSDVLKEL